MIATSVRPDSPLAWIRLRVRVPGPAATRNFLGQILAEVLPSIPVDDTALHRRLATDGVVLSAAADGYGMVGYLTLEPSRLVSTLELLGSALRNHIPADLIKNAHTRASSVWHDAACNGEALADTLSDLAIHTHPTAWSQLPTVVQTPPAVPPVSSIASVGTAHLTYVGGPYPNTLLGNFVSDTSGMKPSDGIAGKDSDASTCRLSIDTGRDSSILTRLAWKAPRRDHIQFAALSVASCILGGHHRSRLVNEFRHDRGWAYSPWSLLRSGVENGLWQLSLRVPRAHAAEATECALHMTRDVRPTDDEVVSAVAHIRTETLRLWSSGATAVTLLGYWQDIALDVDAEKSRWLRALDQVNRDDVTTAISEWLQVDPHLMMTAG